MTQFIIPLGCLCACAHSLAIFIYSNRMKWRCELDFFCAASCRNFARSTSRYSRLVMRWWQFIYEIRHAVVLMPWIPVTNTLCKPIKKISIYAMKFYSSQQAFPFTVNIFIAYNVMISTHSTLFSIESAATALWLLRLCHHHRQQRKATTSKLARNGNGSEWMIEWWRNENRTENW